MAAIMAKMTVIAKMVRGKIEAVLLNIIVEQPTLNSLQNLIKQLTTFTSHFETIKWGGNQGFLPLILSEAKMRLTAGDQAVCQA